MHRKRKQPVRMRDVVYEMEVTLEELCHGGAKKVRIWSEVPSGGAGGSGRERVARDIEIGLTTGMCTVSERLGFFFFMCYYVADCREQQNRGVKKRTSGRWLLRFFFSVPGRREPEDVATSMYVHDPTV